MNGGRAVREAPKGFASLSSGLLARKGTAKPAMRPQGFGQMGVGMEDLGWNDMGVAPAEPVPSFHQEEPVERVPSSISALTPSPRHQADVEVAAAEAPVTSPVVEQQRAIAASFGDIEEEAAVPARKKGRKAQAIVSAPRARQEMGAKGKTAFTLRLDPERHLRLRLACAVTRRSAQQIVAGALDVFLDSLPEIDALAGQVPSKRAVRG